MPTYQEKLDQSIASSWNVSFPVIMREITNTINIIKRPLANSDNFKKDLDKLRNLYVQVSELNKRNKNSNSTDISKEMELVQNMIDIINSYADQTKLYNCVEKRVTRAAMGSPIATVTSFYYKVGRDIGFSTRRLSNVS